MPVKAPPVQTAFDWTGLYIGAHAGYSRGSSSAVLSDPAGQRRQQFLRRGDRRRAGRLQLSAAIRTGCSASKPTFVSELSQIEFRGLLGGDGPIGCQRAMGLCRDRARPRRLRGRSVARLCHRRAGVDGRALRQFTRHRHRGEDPEHKARLGRGRRRGICLRGALERAAGISLQPVRHRRHRLCLRHALRLDDGFPVAAGRAQPQDRLAGFRQFHAGIADRSGIRSLGNPRPIDLPAAGLSGISRALFAAPTA